MKLNLGAGHKHMPGFVNVDLAGNWSTIEPDIAADITQPLPFPDDSADEIHSYHCVEHFWRWKIQGILREWRRVLKPGGLMVLECPCLDKILAIYFNAMERGKAPPKELTIQGLFGNPAYKSEAMAHKWCYSLLEMRDVLTQVGFTQIKQAEPKTHVAGRDMRLECIK